MSRALQGVLSEAALVVAALAEDIGDGDHTTRWTVSPSARGVARIVARQEGVVAGRGPAARVFETLDPDVSLRWRKADGEHVNSEEEILRVEGLLRPILTAERTALNFLGRLSGIASLTARFVSAVAGTGCRITDTRKTTPGWRKLEKLAVAAGGAVNHRAGLYDMALIKENHAAAAGGLVQALRRVRAGVATHPIPVEVEVRSLAELAEILGEGPDRVLLDNFPVEMLAKAVRAVAASPEPRPVVEASGGITLDNVRAVAETGVDLISIGALTHSAACLDLSLLVVS
ncbi:MAG: carboxylating nicotinate-nucleotide diphosphorylase [Gemmatimonadota bacterium]